MVKAWLALFAAVALAGCSEEEPVEPAPDVSETPAVRETAAHSAKDALSIDQFREGQRGSFVQRDPDADNVVDLADLTPRYRKQFKRMDADKDHRVTRAELERSITERFAAADQNKDGMLQPAEWQ